MTPREEFENAIIIKLNIPENVYLLKEIQDKTKIIQDHQFSEFISKLSQKRDYHKVDEKLDAVVKEFENELKSELFAGVEEKAKVLNGKLEALFRQIENLFSPNHPTYDKAIVRRLNTPSGYIAEAKIIEGTFWKIKEVQVVSSIGLSRCYTVFNDPYTQLNEVIEGEIKNLIVKNFYGGNRKQIGGLNIKKIGA